MNAAHSLFLPRESLAAEAGCLLAGTAVTLTLFFGLAHFQQGPHAAAAPETEELRTYTLPPEVPPPPPPTLTTSNEPSAALPLTAGLEASASESPVHVAAGPIAFDLPSTPVTVPLEMSVTRVYPEFKPGADLTVSEQHIYQEMDVDQLPRAIQRSLQFIPYALRINLNQIRVVLVVLMEKNGKASSVRIVKSCGTPALDEIVARSVHEDWVFSPAIKRGRPVRCYIQQTFIIKLVPGSPLEAQ